MIALSVGRNKVAFSLVFRSVSNLTRPFLLPSCRYPSKAQTRWNRTLRRNPAPAWV